MNVLSLFSGIGALDLGLKLAVPAARTVAYVEADGYCQRLLAARIADGSLDPAPLHGDVTTFDGRPWRGCVDLVLGGFPCVDISNAGRRDGIKEGNRSGLWFEFARIVREVRPRLVFAENVSALLGRGMDTVLGDLSGLGFDAWWGVVSAADVGAPHLRRRVFMLAHAQNQRHEWSGPAWGRRDGSANGIGLLADTHRAQRRQDPLAGGRGGEGGDGEGEAAGGLGERGFALADAQGQRGELRAAQGGRPGGSAGGGSAVGDAAVGDGLDVCGRRHDFSGKGQRDAGDAGPTSFFPPGPGDTAAWERVLRERPDLAPAQPGVRGVADGSARRLDRLRALGNAVAPLQAAAAFGLLAARAGLI